MILKAEAEKEQVKSLVSNMSHQLKTPLANLSIYAEILNGQELEEKKKAEVAEKIKKQSDKLEKKGIMLVSETYEDILLFHNRKWTVEVFVNLLENAIKYTQQGGTIQIKVCPYEIFIFFGSAFARKKEGEKAYRSYGQVGFFVFILLNAVTLGTWSFTVNTNSVPLVARLLRTFDIVHNAGLLEMYGQLLITSALATKHLVMTEGRSTCTRSIREIPVNRSEILTLIAGFLLMFAGALVESRAIIG